MCLLGAYAFPRGHRRLSLSAVRALGVLRVSGLGVSGSGFRV